jgi:hypothetical protein
MVHRHVLVLFSTLSLSAGTCYANHGPGTSGGGTSTPSGETLRPGAFEVSLRADATFFEEFTRAQAEAHAIQSGEFDALDRSLLSTIGLSYGLVENLQLGVQAGWYHGTNFISAEADGGGGAESATADPEGFTDTWVTSKWRVMHGPSGHLALLGGVKLPTGEDNERLSNGEKLEPSGQPGTGAFDAQLGLGYSRYLTPRWTLDAGAAYTLRGEHDDFRVGDRIDAGVAFAYRLTESVKQFPNWSASGELLGVWLDKDEEGSEANENSGGTALFAAPGVRCRFDEHVAFSLSAALPVAQDWNGDQPDTRAKVAAVLSLSF